jgi:hypothetical protein
MGKYAYIYKLKFKHMKKLTIILIFYSMLSQGQVNNEIEGITINAPCKIEYTRIINN